MSGLPFIGYYLFAMLAIVPRLEILLIFISCGQEGYVNNQTYLIKYELDY
jgi:hypothetical protein